MLENPPPRSRYDEEHWKKVTAVYDEAWAAGSTPTKAVAERFKQLEIHGCEVGLDLSQEGVAAPDSEN